MPVRCFPSQCTALRPRERGLTPQESWPGDSHQSGRAGWAGEGMSAMSGPVPLRLLCKVHGGPARHKAGSRPGVCQGVTSPQRVSSPHEMQDVDRVQHSYCFSLRGGSQRPHLTAWHSENTGRRLLFWSGQQVSPVVAARSPCRPRKPKAMPALQACSPPKGGIANPGVSCICRGREGGQWGPVLDSLRPGSFPRRWPAPAEDGLGPPCSLVPRRSCWGWSRGQGPLRRVRAAVCSGGLQQACKHHRLLSGLPGSPGWSHGV